MSVEPVTHTASIVSDYHAWLFLWIWVPLVLLYGCWRSLYRREPDPIRPAGPLVD